jgi:hypothetical protein
LIKKRLEEMMVSLVNQSYVNSLNVRQFTRSVDPTESSAYDYNLFLFHAFAPWQIQKNKGALRVKVEKSGRIKILRTIFAISNNVSNAIQAHILPVNIPDPFALKTVRNAAVPSLDRVASLRSPEYA